MPQLEEPPLLPARPPTWRHHFVPAPRPPLRIAISVSGLASHASLLALGRALETRLASADLELVSTEGASGVFGATVTEPGEIVAALADLPGFEVQGAMDGWASNLAINIVAHPIATPEVDSSPILSLPSRRMLHAEHTDREVLPAVEPLPEPTAEPVVATLAIEAVEARVPGSDVPPAPFEAPPAAPSIDAPPTIVEPEPIDAPAPVDAPLPLDEPRPALPTEELVPPEARPGGALPLRDRIALSVYPFHSFGQVSKFQDSLRDLEGVLHVSVARFYRGTLQLRVEYEGLVPLAHRLTSIDGFVAARITQPDDQTIELAIGG